MIRAFEFDKIEKQYKRGSVIKHNKFAGLLLKNQLCFPLYAASKEIVRKYRPYLDKLDLTYTQYITLMVMWEKKTISAKELGGILYLDSGTLTPVLKSLESKSLIKRTRGTDDERLLIISITEQGEALKNQAAEIPPNIAKCVNLDAAEAAELYRLLYKILQ
ncbi:MAG: MarR family transcriptional regulator [Bacteroides sp.]|nr:MarR family transcriptional regulator [Prevotella sp.]MCM1408150.1 MarR family transcriptional regulator [Treponema brennaborense]MCM1469474.1 MarR family transcriptional regulator [Bacteroides sp.]